MLPYMRATLAYGSLLWLSGRSYELTTVLSLWSCLEGYRLCSHLQGKTNQRDRTILGDDEKLKAGRIRLARGFRWQPKHTQLMDEMIRPGESIPIDKDGRTNQLHAIGSHDRWIDMKAGDLIQHVAIEGGTQSGKSSTMAKLLQQLVGQNDGPVVIMDPKQTRALAPYARHIAREQNRPYYEVNFATPSTTTKLNPLSTCTSPGQVKDRVGVIVPFSPSNPQFHVFPLGVLGRVASMMKTVNEWWTLPHLYDYTMSPTRRLRLFKRYLATVKIPTTSEMGIAEIADLITDAHPKRTFIEQVIRDFTGGDTTDTRDPQWLNKLMSNLESSLGDLVSSEVSEVFSAEKTALSWEQVAAEKAIVVLLTDSTAAPDSGKLMAKLILQDIQGYFASRYALASAVFSPFYIMIDELSTIIYPQFLQQIAQAGEAGARYILAWQSQAQLVTPLGGKPGVTALMDNLSTQIVLRVNDEESALSLAKGFGQCTITSRQKALRVASGQSGGPVNASSGLTQQHQQRPLVDPSWLHKLPPGHGFMRLHGEVYKVQFPLIGAPLVQSPLIGAPS